MTALQFDQLPLGRRVAFQTSDRGAFTMFTGLGFEYDGKTLQGASGEYVLRRCLYAVAPVEALPEPWFPVRILSD